MHLIARRRSRWDRPMAELGISDPGPAFRILEPPDPAESVERTPAADALPRRPPRPVPPPPLEAGYRWGMAAARVACEEGEREPSRPGAGPSVEVVSASVGLPAVRFERAVMAVAARTEVLASAVSRLYERIEDIDDRFVDVVTHEDLMELESRRARLAAEVARVSVELKGEMDRRISELGRAVAQPGLARRSASVDHLGPLDLADAKRVEIHLDQVSELDARRSA